jgi:glutamate 5-kinase
MTEQAPSNASGLIESAARIVIKAGSSLIAGPGGSDVRESWLGSLGADIAGLRAQGKEVVVVSSGSVALGRERLGLLRSPRLADKQAAAAAGQSLLMQAWEAALAPHGIATAQLLLTLDDTEKRRRWLNARATLEVLLARRAVPIINENDSVATEELRYGDNDRLSARVAQMIRADLLILLSDVDGFYTADPARSPAAEHIPHVAQIGPEIEALAGSASAVGVGTGGMGTKLMAAKIAGGAGCATLIASGREDHPLRRLGEGARATSFAAAGSPVRAYKQWISGTLAPAGALVVDEGAARALQAGRSLLAAGVTAVEGSFERGSCVSIRSPTGEEIARGIIAYGSEEARLLAGQPTSAMEARLGYRGPDELIHRDDLAMLGR